MQFLTPYAVLIVACVMLCILFTPAIATLIFMGIAAGAFVGLRSK